MKKILGLTVAVLLLLGIAGMGGWAYFTELEASQGDVWAYFTDPETSQDDVLAAGTLDLKTDDVDGVTQTIYAANMKIGDNVSGNITLKNTGTIAGTTLDIAFYYVESDGSPNTVNMSADATAAMMEVTTLNCGGSSLLGSVSDDNSNGYKDIEDLKNADLTGQSGLNPSASKDFEIAVKLKESTDSDFLADGVTATITFILNQ